MADLTLEQQKAIAIAQARQRQAAAQAPPAAAALSPSERFPDLPGGFVDPRARAIEGAITLGSAGLAEPVAGLAGIAATIPGFIGGLVPGGESPAEKAARFGAATVEAVREGITVDPLTAQGAADQEALAQALRPFVEKVRVPLAGLGGVAELVTGQGIEQAAETVVRAQEEGVGPTFAGRLAEEGAPPIVSALVEAVPTGIAAVLGVKGPGAVRLRGPAAVRRAGETAEAASARITQATDKVVATLKKQAEPPSVEKLFESGSAAFRKADEAGVRIKPGSSEGFAERLSARFVEEGLDPILHPKSTQALKRIVEDTQGGLSFKQIETLRRIAKDAAASIERPDARFGRQIIDEIDDYIAQLDGPQATGNVQLAQRSITAARDFWARARKGEILEGLIDRAGIRAGQFSGSGFENAIRTEFRSLALSEKRLRGFSQAEKAAIRRVAEGDTIANALRFVGKFAPRGVISTAITAGGGAAIGGPLGAILLTAGAEAARFAATKATKGAAQRAAEIARTGPPSVTGG